MTIGNEMILMTLPLFPLGKRLERADVTLLGLLLAVVSSVGFISVENAMSTIDFNLSIMFFFFSSLLLSRITN